MEFDKSRVYTVLNADELKVGSKVIVNDCLSTLKHLVENDACTDTLVSIKDETHTARFCTTLNIWYLAYLVEEPKEKKLKWTDLKVGDIIRNNKENKTAMVVQIDNDDCLHICIGIGWLSDSDLEKWEKMEE